MMNGRTQLLVDLEEITFLREFRKVAEQAFGPASDEIIYYIREDFKKMHGYLPESEK